MHSTFQLRISGTHLPLSQLQKDSQEFHFLSILISEMGTVLSLSWNSTDRSRNKWVGLLIFISMEKGNFIATRVGSLMPGSYPCIFLWNIKQLGEMWEQSPEPRTWWESRPELHFCMWTLDLFTCCLGRKWSIMSLKPRLSLKPACHAMWYWWVSPFLFILGTSGMDLLLGHSLWTHNTSWMELKLGQHLNWSVCRVRELVFTD